MGNTYFELNTHLLDIVDNILALESKIINTMGLIKHSMTPSFKYSFITARQETFKNWPVEAKIKPSKLANAGFFYYNSMDRVKCFQCSGILANWDETDDPITEHARHYPECEFIKLKQSTQLEVFEQDTKKLCIICLQRACHFALIPCGHILTCHECVLRVLDCPLCRKNISALLRIYYPV